MARIDAIKEGLEKSLQCHMVEAQRSATAALNMLQADSASTLNFFEVLIEHSTRLHDSALQAQELHRALKRIESKET